MTINSPVAKILLIVLAIIGLLFVLAMACMFLMPGRMMGMMGSPEMAAACHGMLGMNH